MKRDRFCKTNRFQNTLSSVRHVTNHEESLWSQAHFVCSCDGTLDLFLSDPFGDKIKDLSSDSIPKRFQHPAFFIFPRAAYQPLQHVWTVHEIFVSKPRARISSQISCTRRLFAQNRESTIAMSLAPWTYQLLHFINHVLGRMNDARSRLLTECTQVRTALEGSRVLCIPWLSIGIGLYTVVLGIKWRAGLEVDSNLWTLVVPS